MNCEVLSGQWSIGYEKIYLSLTSSKYPLKKKLLSKFESFPKFELVFKNKLFQKIHLMSISPQLVPYLTSWIMPTNSEKAQLSWLSTELMNWVASLLSDNRTIPIVCWYTSDGHGSVRGIFYTMIFWLLFERWYIISSIILS